MDIQTLRRHLSDLPLGEIRYYDRIDSTNLEAARWVEAGAPDLALVVADEQTSGKGRQGRKWYTPPGAALAFSLILRQAGTVFASPDQEERASQANQRITALGALAVCEALHTRYRLPAQIKWPNDVLLQRKKTGGVLAEAHWQGDQLHAIILGIGINVASDSIPLEGGSEQMPALVFPATCIENVLGCPLDRFDLLRLVLDCLLAWRARLAEPAFIHAWDQYLAFKGERVNIMDDRNPSNPVYRQGMLIGLDGQGRLRLQDDLGQEFSLLNGELRMRPAENESVTNGDRS